MTVKKERTKQKKQTKLTKLEKEKPTEKDPVQPIPKPVSVLDPDPRLDVMISNNHPRKTSKKSFLKKVNARRKEIGLPVLGVKGYQEMRKKLQAEGLVVSDTLKIDAKEPPPPPPAAPRMRYLTKRDAEFLRLIVEEGLTPAQAWRANNKKTQPKSASSHAMRKLQQPHVAQALKRMREHAEVILAPVISKNSNLVHLLNVLRTNPGDYFQVIKSGSDDCRVRFTPFEDLTVEQLMQIQEFKLQVNKDGSKSIAYRFHDRLKAIETLNRMMDWNPTKGELDPPKKDQVIHHVLHVPMPVRDNRDYDNSLIESQQWLQKESMKLLGEETGVPKQDKTRYKAITIPNDFLEPLLESGMIDENGNSPPSPERAWNGDDDSNNNGGRLNGDDENED